MTAVKGSKQYKMVVVPHRPLYKAAIFCLCLGAVTALSFSTYEYGFNKGNKTRVEVVEELAELNTQLNDGARIINELRQNVVSLELGGEIDTKANEEVQESIEELQGQIADLNEEIRFYKGVMLPNVEDKGLRIERVDLKPTGGADKFMLSLLLTQVVDKRDYVQGNVEIKLLGTQNGDEKQLKLSEMIDQGSDSIRFRFRYFQNIDSELRVPTGFEPHRVLVVAQSSGRNSQRLEKTFDWQLGGD